MKETRRQRQRPPFIKYLVQILLEKSNNDDRYIEALKAEMSKLKNAPPVVQTKIIFKDKPEAVQESPSDNQVRP